MKLLIVEDDRIQRRFLEALLTKAGHEVVAAGDGLEAWAALQHEHQRLVITDWLMPGMDGQELIQNIRKAEWPHYTYIILLTSRDTHDQKVAGLKSGADDYLTKPIDRDELVARLAIGERILNLEERLKRLASIDGLTALQNRRALYENAKAELSRSSRENSSVSLILIDVDNFKSINDRYGHPAGDQALCLLARILQQDRRAYDQIGRWGGEEFVILLPGTARKEACTVAERLRCRIADSHLPLADGINLQLTVSLGVTSTSGRGNAEAISLEILLHEADRALYSAKALGRNRVCAFDPISEKITPSLSTRPTETRE